MFAIQSEEDESGLFDTSDEDDDEFPSEGSWITASSGSTTSLEDESEKGDNGGGDGPDPNQEAGGDGGDNETEHESLDFPEILQEDDANNNLDDKCKDEELGPEGNKDENKVVESYNVFTLDIYFKSQKNTFKTFCYITVGGEPVASISSLDTSTSSISDGHGKFKLIIRNDLKL